MSYVIGYSAELLDSWGASCHTQAPAYVAVQGGCPTLQVRIINEQSIEQDCWWVYSIIFVLKLLQIGGGLWTNLYKLLSLQANNKLDFHESSMGLTSTAITDLLNV